MVGHNRKSLAVLNNSWDKDSIGVQNREGAGQAGVEEGGILQ